MNLKYVSSSAIHRFFPKILMIVLALIFYSDGLNTLVASESPSTKNSFNEVTKYLDKGGDFYLYLSAEQWLSQLGAKVGDVRKVVIGLPDIDQKEREEIEKVFNAIENLIRKSGVELISAVGMSSIAIEKGLYRNQVILHHYPGKSQGDIWSFYGQPPHDLKGLDWLPSTTAVAAYSDINFSLIWKTIQDFIGTINIKELNAEWGQFLEEFNQKTGTPLEKLIESLGGQWGFILTLDENQKVTVPLPNITNLELPQPGLLFLLKVKDDTLFDLFDRFLKQNPQVTAKNTDDMRMRILPIPTPLPISVNFTLARTGEFLIISLNDQLVEEAVAVKNGKSGIRQSEEFKRVSQGLSLKANAFCFVSQRLGTFIQKIQDQIATNIPQAGAILKLGWSSLLFNTGTLFSQSFIGDEGWIIQENSSNSLRGTALGPALVVPLGLLPAIAIPNFVRAREQAQKNAIRSNLRMIDGAKEQWALENKKATGAKVTEADLADYIRGGKVRSVIGETYEINPISTSPEAKLPNGQVLKLD